MINDREESLASLAQLGDEMEGERVSGELRRLQERFNDLSSGSRKRMCDLEAALTAAKLMQVSFFNFLIICNKNFDYIIIRRFQT